MINAISIKAGYKIYDKIKQGGFSLDDVSILAGASGAAKFLVLTSIDRVLFDYWQSRQKILHGVGTSIGAFRMAAFCHPNPHKALSQLEKHYIEQSYASAPTREEVSMQSQKIMDAFIADNDIEAILHHPFMRLNFFTNSCHGLLKSERKSLLGLGLLLAAGGNLLSRKTLKYAMSRAHFSSNVKDSPFDLLDDFPTSHHQLTQENFKPALLACGSIPIVMKGVDNITGVDGMHRDGGIMDYHLDIPYPCDEGEVVLYPHFYDSITPGWFDKNLKRRGTREYLANVLLVSPSREFVSQLPYQKIPDRNDFTTFVNDNSERIRYWYKTVEMSQVIGEQFAEAIDSGAIKDCVKPL